jgi:hypothetical protein
MESTGSIVPCQNGKAHAAFCKPGEAMRGTELTISAETANERLWTLMMESKGSFAPVVPRSLTGMAN